MNEEIEPNEFFQEIKSLVTTADMTMINQASQFLYDTARRAKTLGQTNLLHKTAYAYSIMEREVRLYDLGIVQWVDRVALEKFIDKVEPRGSVRVCLLKDYPRVIPEVNASEIEKVKALGIFDDIVIVYTDFTKEDVKTPEQKAQVARNKDPIALGVFYNEKLRLRHDRLYLITDWEDELCDLTFTKLVDRMASILPKESENHGVFKPDDEGLIEATLKEIEVVRSFSNKTPKSFFERLVIRLQSHPWFAEKRARR